MACSSDRLKLLVVVLFVCLIVAIVVPLSIMVHNRASESDDVDSDMASVLKRYGQFFVALEDEAALKSKLVKTARTNDGRERTFNLCLVNTDVLLTSVNYNNSSSSSSNNISSSRLIAMDSHSKLSAPCGTTTHLHGCCNSTIAMIVPATAISPKSGKVTLVQYPPRFVQMFSVETCQTVDSCDLNCKCFNVLSYATAVVRNKEKKVSTDVIQYKGCCKCMNNA